MHNIESLYRQYKQDLYRYLLSLTRQPSLAEDLLSETFLKAIHALPAFKGQSSIKSWLFGIARNVWLQQLRTLKPQLEYSDLLQIYMTETMEEQYVTKESADRVKALLAAKDERTQAVVRMRVDGYSYHEISDKLGISENSARVIDFRTKKWIQTSLEKEGLR